MWGNETNFSDVREVLALFSTIDTQIDELEKPLQEAFKRDVLFNLQGKSFGSYENNRNVAERLRDLLYRLHLRIKCLKPGCGKPSILVCHKVSRAQNGMFQCHHREAGHPVTHAGSPAIPNKMILIDPAPDLRRR